MKRRQFLTAIPAVAGLAQAAGAHTGLRIKQVDIVHHTHTDVGFTALPSVVRDLQKSYIDAAIDACRA